MEGSIAAKQNSHFQMQKALFRNGKNEPQPSRKQSPEESLTINMKKLYIAKLQGDRDG